MSLSWGTASIGGNSGSVELVIPHDSLQAQYNKVPPNPNVTRAMTPSERGWRLLQTREVRFFGVMAVALIVFSALFSACAHKTYFKSPVCDLTLGGSLVSGGTVAYIYKTDRRKRAELIFDVQRDWDLLGGGSFGDVWSCHRGNRSFALKDCLHISYEGMASGEVQLRGRRLVHTVTPDHIILYRPSTGTYLLDATPQPGDELCHILMHKLEGYEQFHDVIDELDGTQSQKLKHLLVKAVREFHRETGYAHGDLNTSNILVKRNDAGEVVDVQLVDLGLSTELSIWTLEKDLHYLKECLEVDTIPMDRPGSPDWDALEAQLGGAG